MITDGQHQKKIPCNYMSVNGRTQYHLWSILAKNISPNSDQVSRFKNQFARNSIKKHSKRDHGCNQQNSERGKHYKTNNLVSSTNKSQI